MAPHLRRHQALALDALDRHWQAGGTRAWVVLPPGAGKTLVGLETVRRRCATDAVDKAVVLGPNTAIQAQWLAQAAAHGLTAGAERDLTTPLTALTYQAVAVFDPDAEVTDDAEETPLLSRLHGNGRRLVEALRAAGPILLVLDECHHLLVVWGRLLAELLDLLPEAQVLGLTATPPDALTSDEAALVADLFGDVVFETSIPAVVREGDLAPFAELAWLTEPTTSEAEWLSGQAERFQELVTQLTDPTFGSVPFLEWLDRRFVLPVGTDVSWAALSKQEPALCTAALRMHHHGLLALPEGARLLEQHRRDPTADDWVLLVDDWLTRHLSRTEVEEDAAVVDAVRRALPAVGYQWTRRGIRRGRSPVDRVLARSESKAEATVEIVRGEHLNLGDRLRMLVLCDHERASATLPVSLTGVLAEQAGSALAMLSRLVADPATAGLGPLLVTGRTVAAAPETLAALVARVAETDRALAGSLSVVDAGDGVARLEGPWTSRVWVGHVTRFFEDGGSRVLVGTRGLLGEGWDARRVTGLVDLTAVTTATAVVQTRGRALRTDPTWPDKVALNWSVVCVTDEHPKGDNDWQRVVRKHAGFFGVDADGDVVDGVAHLDPLFSPYASPAVDSFDAVNARMVVRAEDRAAIAGLWRVGAPYDDRAARTVRIVPRRPRTLGRGDQVPVVVAGRSALEVRHADRPSLVAHPAAASAGFGLVAIATASAVAWALPVGLVLLVLATLLWGRTLAAHGRRLVAEAAEPPSVTRVASAVADGLHAAGLTSAGAEAVRVEVDHDGEYRCVLHGVPEAESATFAGGLDEAVSPLVSPRYVLPRYVVSDSQVSVIGAVGAAFGRHRPDGEVWHAVPSVLGTNATRAKAYAAAWHRWVGGGDPLFTGSPEGAGVLAAQQGSDPFDVSTVMRTHWA